GVDRPSRESVARGRPHVRPGRTSGRPTAISGPTRTCRRPAATTVARARHWPAGGGEQRGTGGISGLVVRARGYGREAVAGLYRLTVPPVFRYLSARLDRIDEVEEVTQEVFVAALASIHSLRAGDEAGLFAWLFQIARNKLADHLRRRYRHGVDRLDGQAD